MRDLERAESEMRPTLHNNGGDDEAIERAERLAAELASAGQVVDDHDLRSSTH